MKKILLTMFMSLLALCFTACTEEEITCSESSASYDDFLSYKNAWKEPESYSYTCAYSIGDSSVGSEFSVVVTDGKGEVTPNEIAEMYHGWDIFGETREDFLKKFSTITNIYEYFDSIWQKEPEKWTKDSYVSYHINFKIEDEITYPVELCQSSGVPDTEGYGGQCFMIKNFSVKEK